MGLSMYLSLSMCTHYDYMYVHTQGGVQAIHNAATHGHIGLISVLVEKYGVDPQEKADVCKLVCSQYIYSR